MIRICFLCIRKYRDKHGKYSRALSLLGYLASDRKLQQCCERLRSIHLGRLYCCFPEKNNNFKKIFYQMVLSRNVNLKGAAIRLLIRSKPMLWIKQQVAIYDALRRREIWYYASQMSFRYINIMHKILFNHSVGYQSGLCCSILSGIMYSLDNG